MEIGYWLDRSLSLGKENIFHWSTSSRPVLAPSQPLIPWVPGIHSMGHQADYTIPTSSEVKKTWIYTSTHPYAFMA
jgi:hypothetical protein